MAQLNSRGTLIRTRWDYFEQTNGWAFVQGNVPTGNIGCYFANNSTGALQLDIYNLTWFASTPMTWAIVVMIPPLVLTPLTPTDSQVRSIQPDARTLAGVVGMYTASASLAYTLQSYVNTVTSGALQPVGGMPSLSLPPGWALAVGGAPGAVPSTMSMSVWYQEVTDNVAPAT